MGPSLDVLNDVIITQITFFFCHKQVA